MHYRIPAHEVAAHAARITHLFLDCDGVLTDGSIYIGADGGETKRFDIHDGHGIVLWRRAGHRVAIISGRASRSLEARAQELGVEYLVQGALNKLDSFRDLLDRTGILPEEVAMMGDDVVDIPLMLRSRLAAAPSNAVSEVVEAAHLVTARAGGHGAVRELVETILKAQGRWEALMGRYQA
jgi:3-deoxy-D-manno-octulosonate 8-phosphate phosphatase (KDO 8-P phosphatase)